MYTPDSQAVLDLLISTELRIKASDSHARFNVEFTDDNETIVIQGEFIIQDCDQTVGGIELTAPNIASAHIDDPAAVAIFHDLLEFNTQRGIGSVTFDPESGSIGYSLTDWLPLIGEDATDDRELLYRLISCFARNALQLRALISRARTTRQTRRQRSQHDMSSQIDQLFEQTWDEFGDSLE